MIIDTSALVAILEREPEGARFRELLRGADSVSISAGTMLEAAIVLDSRDPTKTSRLLDALVEALGVQIVPVDEQQVRVARAAYRDFGRGSSHPAQLNFGDCFAYALATITREPLLFKGDDFGHTDVLPAA